MTGAGVTRVILSASVWVLKFCQAQRLEFPLMFHVLHVSSRRHVCPSGGDQIFFDSLGLVERRVTEWRVLCLWQLFAEPFGSSLCNKPSKVSVNVFISFVNS